MRRVPFTYVVERVLVTKVFYQFVWNFQILSGLYGTSTCNNLSATALVLFFLLTNSTNIWLYTRTYKSNTSTLIENKVQLWRDGVLIHIWTKGEVGAPLNWFKPSSKIVLLAVPRRCFFCGLFMLLQFCFARLFVTALWSPAGKGLISWLSCVMSNCDVVTFPLVSWVRCGAWLYRFAIFALFLTFKIILQH